MKRKYLKPEATVVLVENCAMLAASAPLNARSIETMDNAGDSKRGKWGDVWNN